MELIRHTLNTTIQELASSITRHMPAVAYREFCLWGLSPENEAQSRWLQVMGITQTVQLTFQLFKNLITPEEYQRLAPYSAIMNVYLTFEVVSDNLAIGLAQQRLNDSTFSIRRDVLHAFNCAVMDRLQGGDCPQESLHPLRPTMNLIDGFEQSLNGQAHREIAQIYLAQQDHTTLEDLAHHIWPGLVFNAEAVAEVAHTVAEYQAGSLVREGLLNRYQAVNDLLQEANMPLSKRLNVGADAILVAPTLAYYAAVFAEKLRPLEGFKNVLDNGTLEQVLYEAAILVRLLNDIGTRLLISNPSIRAEVVEALQTRQEDVQNIYELLLDVPHQYRPWLTRIRKDITHGEFNIGLAQLDHLPTRETLDLFRGQLDYLAQFYMQTRTLFVEHLQDISCQLGDKTISSLVERFVAFHEKLYSNNYEEAVGEYAV